MVSELTGRRRAVDVALQAVVAHTADGQRAALHEEVLVARDAVLHSLLDVDGGILQLHVLSTLDGVGQLAVDIERALALQLEVALAVEGRLLVAAGIVDERVLGVLLHAEVNALAIHDVDGGTAIDGVGVGQRQSVELDGSLVRARHVELAVAGLSAERVGNLLCHVAALDDADVSPTHGDGDVAGHVAGNEHLRLVAVVNHLYGVVHDVGVVHVHAVYLAEVVHLIQNSDRLTALVNHLAGLGRRNLVGDIAHLDVERLCREGHPDHRGCRKGYDSFRLHFLTVILVVVPFCFTR